MAGAGPEILVDMNQLTPGIEYTFILNDGDRLYGMLETYLGNDGIPRRAVRLANGYKLNGERHRGTRTISLDSVNRVVQHGPRPDEHMYTQSGGKKQKINRKKSRKSRRKSSRRRKSSKRRKY